MSEESKNLIYDNIDPGHICTANMKAEMARRVVDRLWEGDAETLASFQEHDDLNRELVEVIAASRMDLKILSRIMECSEIDLKLFALNDPMSIRDRLLLAALIANDHEVAKKYERLKTMETTAGDLETGN